MGTSKLDTLAGRPDFIKKFVKSYGKTENDILAADATETSASAKVAHQGWTIPAGGNDNPNAMRETIIAMNIGSDIGTDDDAGLGIGGGGGGGASYDSNSHESSPVTNQYGSGMETYTSSFLTIDNMSATQSLSGGAGAHFYLNTIATNTQMVNTWASLGFMAGQGYSPNGYRITINARVRDLDYPRNDFAGWADNIIFQMKIIGNPTVYQYDIDTSSIVCSDSTKTFADFVQAKQDADAVGANPPYNWEIQLYKGIPPLVS